MKPLKQAIAPEEHWRSPWHGAGLTLTSPNCEQPLRPNPLPANHGPTTSVRLNIQFNGNDWEGEFASQVQGIFTARGSNVKSICASYFEAFHPWLSFIHEPDFWRGYSSAGTDPEYSILLLGMYLLTYIPAQHPHSTGSIDPVYDTAAGAWSHLQKYKEPSIVLIQAGLLLSTYEGGQALETKSRSTMVACAEMGYKMRLHKSLRQKGGNAVTQQDLERKRRLWWGIMALER